MTTLHLRKSIGRSPLRHGFILLSLTFILAWLALAPTMQAVVPAPDGGYPGANTAEGNNALLNLTSGTGDTAVGHKALLHTTTGSGNVGTGTAALMSNIAGNNNTANGFQALYFNIGDNNTAFGATALFSNTTGPENTAAGVKALASNTTGEDNTATGYRALSSNTEGDFNTAIGESALFGNTEGQFNIALGSSAGLRVTTGDNNIALGTGAGSNLTTGDNNIDIGNFGVAAEANTIRIGVQGTQTATFIAGISGATVMGTAVVVDGSGQLGVATSSARFKEAIKSMDNASEALFSLNPVTFRYKKEIDPKSTAQFGLVAEDVEKVNADLVVRDAEGKVYTVRYEAVNAMLLNEFLKEHREVAELKSTVAEQRKGMEAMAAQLKEQAAQIQKVSAQIEASKPAPQVVNNP